MVLRKDTITSTAPITASIRLRTSEEALELFGENDKNLKRLREKLGAKIIARGDAIKLEGTPEDIRIAESLIRDLLSVVRQGGEFSLDEIDRGAVISSNGGSMFEDTNMDNKDLELPKRLRPKTKGQKAYIEAINASDITFGIGPAGTGKCVSGDTLVLTQCGIVPISSLAEGVELEEQRRKPTRIFGLDGREWSTHVYNGGVQNTIRLQTRHGFSIEGTAEHPLLTLNQNGEPEWIRMDQVKQGTKLALTRGSGFWGNNTGVQHQYNRLDQDKSSTNIKLTELDPEFAYFMGLIVGDGCTTKRGYVLFASYDEELRSSFRAIAARFGLHVTKHGSSLRLNSTQLSSLLMHLGIGTAKAHQKTMPDCILRAPREINIAFIQGLFDTDGHASKRDGYPSLCSSSQKLIEAVQIVLMNLGLVSMVWRKKTTHLDTFILELRGLDAKHFYDLVGFRLPRKQERKSQLKTVLNTNIDVIPNLALTINEAVKAQPLTHKIHKWIYDYRIGRREPSYKKLEQILEVCHAPSAARQRLEWLAARQLLWSEVKEITHSRAHVYDLTVPGTHSFTANGFVSHNSYLAVAMAVAAFKAKRVKRIILTRPAVEAGERLGFLPGDLQAKIDPYLRPLYDALFDMIDAERFESYLSSGAIEVAPLAFMRGRAQPLTSKVLTPLGWREMGSLEVGDYVIGSNGKPTQVLEIFPQGEKDTYQVTMTDGSSTLCCEEHLWTVLAASDKRRGKPARTLETREMIGNLKSAHQYRYELPLLSAPVEFAARDIPLDPYALGLLLGDGCITGSTTPGFASNDPELVMALENALKPLEVQPVFKGNYDYTLKYAKGGRGGVIVQNPLTLALRELKLEGTRSSTKFIPEVYLNNTSEIRLAVLQGLLDTDGNACTQTGRTCRVQYTTTSEQLRDDVIGLVRSLGGVAYTRTRVAEGRKPGLARGREIPYRSDAFVLEIRLPDGMKPFRLERKAVQVNGFGAGRPMRFVRSIEKTGRAPMQCIRVAAADHLYVTDDYIVTHNTLNDAFIILDEAQNTTPEQMKMFLTRMGFSSKVVVTGDVTQVDLPKNVTSGLEQAKRYLQGIDGINFVYFTESDVVRHPLVGRIIHAYEEHS